MCLDALAQTVWVIHVFSGMWGGVGEHKCLFLLNSSLLSGHFDMVLWLGLNVEKYTYLFKYV